MKGSKNAEACNKNITEFVLWYTLYALVLSVNDAMLEYKSSDLLLLASWKFWPGLCYLNIHRNLLQLCNFMNVSFIRKYLQINCYRYGCVWVGQKTVWRRIHPCTNRCWQLSTVQSSKKLLIWVMCYNIQLALINLGQYRHMLQRQNVCIQHLIHWLHNLKPEIIGSLVKKKPSALIDARTLLEDILISNL